LSIRIFAASSNEGNAENKVAAVVCIHICLSGEGHSLQKISGIDSHVTYDFLDIFAEKKFAKKLAL
jgi:hypothetical protein